MSRARFAWRTRATGREEGASCAAALWLHIALRGGCACLLPGVRACLAGSAWPAPACYPFRLAGRDTTSSASLHPASRGPVEDVVGVVGVGKWRGPRRNTAAGQEQCCRGGKGAGWAEEAEWEPRGWREQVSTTDTIADRHCPAGVTAIAELHQVTRPAAASRVPRPPTTSSDTLLPHLAQRTLTESPFHRKQSTPQPRAWQGPNPITQRAASGMTNGTEKPLPKLPPQPHDSPNPLGNADKHAHDRLLFAIANCMVSG